MNYTIREIKTSEYPLLDDFLYEAIYIPKGAAPPPRSILTAPELQVYTRRFGAVSYTHLQGLGAPVRNTAITSG